jgi:hypothetical protein
LLAALPALGQAPANNKPASGPTASDMEILKQKIKADKKLLVAENMKLNDAEAKAFWPVYDEYQKGLAGLNDRMGKVITSYASIWNKGSVPAETARKLIDESLAIEEDEVTLKKAMLPKPEKAVGGMKAARYLQIESKVRAVIKNELAAEIPLVN